MIKEVVIVRQPLSVCVPVNHQVTLSVSAEGKGVLGYQWFTGDTGAVIGATQADLTFRAQRTELYVCRVNDQHRNSEFSEWVKVKVLDVDKSVLPDQWRGEPHIAINPRAQVVRPGEKISLQCAAFGIPLPQYQWYRNGVEIAHKASNTLQIDEAKTDHGGTYLCAVSNVLEEKWTEPVDVVVQTEQCLPSILTATDKVALLIGNLNYMHYPDLMAPFVDVRELANLLQQLDFRVVSLLDLTKEEMQAAIDQFIQLLDKGVYGLFYYAGHGYERAGRNYLVAIDAPQPYRPENCVCVQRTMHRMQQRQTALNVVLLDTCRKWYNQDCIPSEIKPLEPKGNTVYGYATCEDAEAFEVQDGGKSTGIFTKYLNKHILQSDKVTHVLERVSEDLGRDPLVSNKQAVEIKHTLREPRSLADPVRTAGHTMELHVRDACWRQANDIPRKRRLMFLCGVEVQISFSALFSNVMVAFATVKATGPRTQDCAITLSSSPAVEDVFFGAGGSEEMDSLLPQRVDCSGGMLRICALQKLKESLIIKIDLHYTHKDSKKRLTESQQVNIGKPLVASCNFNDTHHARTKKMQEGASAKSNVSRGRLCATQAGSGRPFTRKAECASAIAATKSNEPEENDENDLQ